MSPHDDAVAVHAGHHDGRAGINKFPVGHCIEPLMFNLSDACRSQRHTNQGHVKTLISSVSVTGIRWPGRHCCLILDKLRRNITQPRNTVGLRNPVSRNPAFCSSNSRLCAGHGDGGRPVWPGSELDPRRQAALIGSRRQPAILPRLRSAVRTSTRAGPTRPKRRRTAGPAPARVSSSRQTGSRPVPSPSCSRAWPRA